MIGDEPSSADFAAEYNRIVYSPALSFASLTPSASSTILGARLERRPAEVAELADALDSNSSEAHTSCGFDPRLRH